MAPVASSVLAVPAGRTPTSPRTAMTNSARNSPAMTWAAAERSGLKTTWVRPWRSRRSTNMRPPWSRRRCTQPFSTTWPPASSTRSWSQVTVRFICMYAASNASTKKKARDRLGNSGRADHPSRHRVRRRAWPGRTRETRESGCPAGSRVPALPARLRLRRRRLAKDGP